MLKKILAASSAAVVALSAMATVAMADDVADIVINAPKQTDKYVEFDLQGEITGLDLYKLLVKENAVAADMSTAQSWDKLSDGDNAYNHMLMGVWVSPTEYFYAMDENWQGISWYNEYKPTDSKNQLLFQDPSDNNKWKSRKNRSDGNYIEIKNVEFATELFASVQKYKAVTNASVDSNQIVYEEDGDPTSDSTTAKVSGSGDLVSADGAKGGATTKPVDLSASFGLNAKKALRSIDFDQNKSKVTVKFTVKMDANVFRGLGKDSNKGQNWNWGTNNNWDDASAFFKGEEGTATLNEYFGIVGEAGTYNRETKQWTKKGAVGTGVRVKMIGDARDAGTTEKIGGLPLPAGTIPIGVGQNATIPQLKALTNGGTITFEFDKAVNSRIIVGTIQCLSTNGQVALPLGSDFAFDEGGKTLTMKFNPGYTYDPNMNNAYNSFKIMYNFEQDTVVGIVDPTQKPGETTVGNTNFGGKDKYDGKLIKVTIKANAKAPDNTSSSTSDGGLVSSSTTSSSTPSSSATNSGSNNGEKNPGTGVAVAVAPVVLAAAGAAVVISKKRK